MSDAPHSKSKSPPNKKSKDTAVVLAVFFGLFSWLYTYDRDKSKFWINVGLLVCTLGYWWIIGWLWALIDSVRRPRSFYGRKKIAKAPYIILGAFLSMATALVSLATVSIYQEFSRQTAAEEAEQQRLAADPITAQGVYIALNKVRADSGAAALSSLSNLTIAAEQKCNDMVAGSYFEYKNPKTGKESNSYIADNQGDLYFKHYVTAMFSGSLNQTATEIVDDAVSYQATNLNNPIYNSVGWAVCDSPDKASKYVVGMLAEKAEKPKPAPAPVYRRQSIHCSSSEILGTVYTNCY